MTAVRRALADVGEAPRHEVAGDVGRGCAGLYGDLPIAPVLAMIASGEIQVESMITHHFPYWQAKEAYDLLYHNPGEAFGVILDWPE